MPSGNLDELATRFPAESRLEAIQQSSMLT
jgi:hypothetical protein